MPDDQFQLDAERHAEFFTFVTVQLRQFLAIQPQFGRQLGPVVAVVAVVVGEFRAAIAVRQFWVLRQCGFIRAGRIPIWRVPIWRIAVG